MHTQGGEYPVNLLRNVALEAAQSDYVLLLDVDFVMSKGAHDTLYVFIYCILYINIVLEHTIMLRLKTSPYQPTPLTHSHTHTHISFCN